MCLCGFVWLRGGGKKKRKGQSKEIVPLFHMVPLCHCLKTSQQKDRNQPNKHKEMNQNTEVGIYCVRLIMSNLVYLVMCDEVKKMIGKALMRRPLLKALIF